VQPLGCLSKGPVAIASFLASSRSPCSLPQGTTGARQRLVDLKSVAEGKDNERPMAHQRQDDLAIMGAETSVRLRRDTS
jgi:hypothetical protein